MTHEHSDVEEAPSLKPLALLLLRSPKSLGKFRDGRTCGESEEQLACGTARRFIERGKADLLVLAPNPSHLLFRTDLQRKRNEEHNEDVLNCKRTAALRAVVAEYSARYPASDLLILSTLATLPALLFASLDSSTTLSEPLLQLCLLSSLSLPMSRLLYFPEPSSPHLPIPAFPFPGALETGNMETGYKLQRADWAVCSRAIPRPVFQLWDAQLWFGLNKTTLDGAEYRLEKVGDLEGCVGVGIKARMVGDKGTGMEEKPALGTAEGKGRGEWPKLKNCLNKPEDPMSRLFSSVAGSNTSHILLITAPEPLHCNFYLGIFGHSGIWFPPFHLDGSKEANDDYLATSELWSPSGYHVGHLHHPRQGLGFVWAELETRAWEGYGGWVAHVGAEGERGKGKAEKEWQEELWKAIEAQAFS